MSKIELTEKQVNRLYNAWKDNNSTDARSCMAILDKAIELGLVRPASDDLAKRLDSATERCKAHANILRDFEARVAALEAKVGGNQWDKAPDTYDEEAARGIAAAHNTPDPHAAAKERAKERGIELVECGDDNEGWGRLMFISGKHWLKADKGSKAEWCGPATLDNLKAWHGYYRTPSEAWSNFPTEPPPGWEAPKDHGFGDNDSWTGPTESKPRTEADRLGEVAWNASFSGRPNPAWCDLCDDSKEANRVVALAVRKAVLAGQLEPSEEEIDKACNAYLPHYAASTPSVVESVRRGVTAALTAAARVRLEKAEGEKP